MAPRTSTMVVKSVNVFKTSATTNDKEIIINITMPSAPRRASTGSKIPQKLLIPDKTFIKHVIVATAALAVGGGAGYATKLFFDNKTQKQNLLKTTKSAVIKSSPFLTFTKELYTSIKNTFSDVFDRIKVDFRYIMGEEIGTMFDAAKKGISGLYKGIKAVFFAWFGRRMVQYFMRNFTNMTEKTIKKWTSPISLVWGASKRAIKTLFHIGRLFGTVNRMHTRILKVGAFTKGILKTIGDVWRGSGTGGKGFFGKMWGKVKEKYEGSGLPEYLKPAFDVISGFGSKLKVMYPVIDITTQAFKDLSVMMFRFLGSMEGKAGEFTKGMIIKGQGDRDFYEKEKKKQPNTPERLAKWIEKDEFKKMSTVEGIKQTLKDIFGKPKPRVKWFKGNFGSPEEKADYQHQKYLDRSAARYKKIVSGKEKEEDRKGKKPSVVRRAASKAKTAAGSAAGIAGGILKGAMGEILGPLAPVGDFILGKAGDLIKNKAGGLLKGAAGGLLKGSLGLGKLALTGLSYLGGASVLGPLALIGGMVALAKSDLDRQESDPEYAEHQSKYGSAEQASTWSGNDLEEYYKRHPKERATENTKEIVDELVKPEKVRESWWAMLKNAFNTPQGPGENSTGMPVLPGGMTPKDQDIMAMSGDPLVRGLIKAESGGSNVWTGPAQNFLRSKGALDKSLQEQDDILRAGIRSGEYTINGGAGSTAFGPGQMTGTTAESLGYNRNDRFDPNKNIEMTTKYLNQLLENKGGDVQAALRAYTGNSGGQAHIDKILQNAEDFKKSSSFGYPKTDTSNLFPNLPETINSAASISKSCGNFVSNMAEQAGVSLPKEGFGGIKDPNALKRFQNQFGGEIRGSLDQPLTTDMVKQGDILSSRTKDHVQMVVGEGENRFIASMGVPGQGNKYNRKPLTNENLAGYQSYNIENMRRPGGPSELTQAANGNQAAQEAFAKSRESKFDKTMENMKNIIPVPNQNVNVMGGGGGDKPSQDISSLRTHPDDLWANLAGLMLGIV